LFFKIIDFYKSLRKIPNTRISKKRQLSLKNFHLSFFDDETKQKDDYQRILRNKDRKNK
jgi:hypothetical protein